MIKRGVTITIYYPGSVISCNHYLGRRKDGGEYVKPEARAWMDALGWMIKPYHIEDWNMPIKITVSGVFKNLRSCPDAHNLLKCTCDAIDDATGLNDRDYKTETTKPKIDSTVEPELQITIEEVE